MFGARAPEASLLLPDQRSALGQAAGVPRTVYVPVGRPGQGLLLDLFAALCYSFMVREKVRLELGLQDYFV